MEISPTVDPEIKGFPSASGNKRAANALTYKTRWIITILNSVWHHGNRKINTIDGNQREG